MKGASKADLLVVHVLDVVVIGWWIPGVDLSFLYVLDVRLRG